MSDADVIVFPMIPVPRPDEPAPAMTRAEHDRAAFLNVQAFATAEKLAEGARQSAVEQAAVELRAAGNNKGPADYDKHNAEVDRAERKYLQDVISAAEKHGIVGHWKRTLATLPRPVTARQWAEGKGKW